MLTFLTAIAPTLIGLFSSAIPNLVKYLERSQENKHEVELIKLKMEAAAQGLEYDRIAATVKATVEEGKSIRDHDVELTDNKFINMVRASIRPVLTIFFFLCFVAIKATVAWIMISNGAPAELVLNTVWDVYTNAIFGAIMGFYFGTYAIINMMEQTSRIGKNR